MKALVCYHSQTGNTRQVAEAIHGALSCEKELRPLAEVGGLAGYDVAFVGFPIWQLGPADEARLFLEQKAAGSKLALFVTHAMSADDAEPMVRKLLERIFARCRRCADHAQWVDLFDCRGELSQAVASQMAQSGNPMLQAFAAQRASTAGHPSALELEGARAFAAKVLVRVGG